jgi:hypothetical protein
MTEVTRLRELAERCLALARSFRSEGDGAALRKIAADSLEQADRPEGPAAQQQQQPQERPQQEVLNKKSAQ